MNKEYWLCEFGKDNPEDVRRECLNILDNIKNVIDIKGLNYIRTFIILAELKEK